MMPYTFCTTANPGCGASGVQAPTTCPVCAALFNCVQGLQENDSTSHQSMQRDTNYSLVNRHFAVTKETEARDTSHNARPKQALCWRCSVEKPSTAGEGKPETKGQRTPSKARRRTEL